MSKEVKVGLFAIISGVILYLGFNFLKGKDFLSPTNKYCVIYQNIDGLNVSNPVIISGFSVGRVSSISILQELNNQIIVEIDVNENVILGDSTVATLANSDFLGSKAILLAIGDISTPLKDGDTLISAIDRGLTGLFENAEPITANLDVILRRINEILLGMKGAGEDMKSAMEKLNITLASANQFVITANSGVKKTLGGVDVLLANLNQKTDQLDPILSSANTTMANLSGLELEKAVNTLNSALGELNIMLSDINEGQGTIGKMLKEDSLYYTINKTILDLDKLLIHFNENPKHFMSPLGKSRKKIDKERKKEQGK